MEESFEQSDCFLMRSSVLLNFCGVLIQSKMHDNPAKSCTEDMILLRLSLKLFHLYLTNIYQANLARSVISADRIIWTRGITQS
jgi:hypothetical protein